MSSKESSKRGNKSLSCSQFSEFPLHCILSRYSVVTETSGMVVDSEKRVVLYAPSTAGLVVL